MKDAQRAAGSGLALLALVLAACATQAARPSAPVATTPPPPTAVSTSAAPAAPSARERAAPLLEEGEALVARARQGDSSEYELARPALTRCLKVDPEQAECAFLLGEVEEFAEHPQAAAERYTQAIRQDPTEPAYYAPLVGIYRAFKQPNEAERVLHEGVKHVRPSELTRPALARMTVSLAQLTAARRDLRAADQWLEQAEKFYDEGSPEVGYIIGSLYAEGYEQRVAVAYRGKAARLLTKFMESACLGAAATKFKEQCQLSKVMIQMLGVDLDPGPATPVVLPPSPALLPAGLPVPQLAWQPLKNGDAYSVWGASYAFRSRQHRGEVTDAPVAITGYVVKTNLPLAPPCVVHRSGVADPEDCRAPIPTFWLGDSLDAPEADCIKVMGFASNFAQIYDAIRQADSAKHSEPYQDAFWRQTLPNPLPAAGAKVTVTGRYGLTFAKVSSGAQSDPIMGILDYAELTELEAAPELATLPGVKRRKR